MVLGIFVFRSDQAFCYTHSKNVSRPLLLRFNFRNFEFSVAGGVLKTQTAQIYALTWACNLSRLLASYRATGRENINSRAVARYPENEALGRCLTETMFCESGDMEGSMVRLAALGLVSINNLLMR